MNYKLLKQYRHYENYKHYIHYKYYKYQHVSRPTASTCQDNSIRLAPRPFGGILVGLVMCVPIYNASKFVERPIFIFSLVKLVHYQSYKNLPLGLSGEFCDQHISRPTAGTCQGASLRLAPGPSGPHKGPSGLSSEFIDEQTQTLRLLYIDIISIKIIKSNIGIVVVIPLSMPVTTQNMNIGILQPHYVNIMSYFDNCKHSPTFIIIKQDLYESIQTVIHLCCCIISIAFLSLHSRNM